MTNRFVLLCINGPQFTQLEQVPLSSQEVSIASHDNNGNLFDSMRKRYIEVRRSSKPSFHPETLYLVRTAFCWTQRAWIVTQKWTTKVFKPLRIQWLVCWTGDDVFFIPKSTEFVKVGSDSPILSHSLLSLLISIPGKSFFALTNYI
jgi:hypothetical protein